MATLLLRRLGLCAYRPVWEAMRDFSEAREADTPDECWLVQHPPVFTQGLNGKPEHLLAPGEIPVVAVDRGGQVTYHGPGQAVLYPLIDLRRRRLGVRHLVSAMEQAVIELLARYHVEGAARPDAPGVYVDGAKVASLGLRVRNGRSYHGLSLNVEVELEPFSRINPCGYTGMAVTRLRDLAIGLTTEAAGVAVADLLARRLGYDGIEVTEQQPGWELP